MNRQNTLLPPLSEVHRRLTENARERAILKGLQKLHAQRLRWDQQSANADRHDRQNPNQ